VPTPVAQWNRPLAAARGTLVGAFGGPELRARREAILAGGFAAALSSLIVSLLPQGGDAPAHLYRTLLLQHGIVIWDNLWYAGQYPFASYSLLYYLPAAAIGNITLTVASVVCAAALFAALVLDEWGEIARWPARAFGLLAAAPLYTGSYSYAAGFAALLGTLRALQKGRTFLGVVAAALTLGFSPLAFVFLCLALGAAFLKQRRLSGRALVVSATLVLLLGIQLGTLALFPSPGRYPFAGWQLLAGLATAALGAALALQSRQGRWLAGLFSLWAIANVVAYFVPSPIGHNLLRADELIFPVMLLTALLAGFRPRWLALPALAVALAANVGPDLAIFPSRAADAAAKTTFWSPLLAFLQRHSGPGYRIEVVPTSNHWDAYYLPRAGFALARGWYRQLDIVDNPTLYASTLTRLGYDAWLRSRSVRFVVLPRAPLAPLGASHEAELLSSGRSGLREVYAGATGVIYEVPRAVPILSGPGKAVITAFSHDLIAGRTATRGIYRLRVNYTPYWRVRTGGVCVGTGADGTTHLTVLRPGAFVLTVADDPSELVESIMNGNDTRCNGLSERPQSGSARPGNQRR
jgi:hypothetical protein